MADPLIEPYPDGKKVFLALRGYLLQCSNAEDLRNSENDILTKLHFNAAASTIHVGDKSDPAKNFRRDPAQPHLVRRALFVRASTWLISGQSGASVAGVGARA